MTSDCLVDRIDVIILLECILKIRFEMKRADLQVLEAQDFVIMAVKLWIM